MKTLTFISDTHNQNHKMDKDLPGGDFLFHSGDLTNRGTQKEVFDFLYWFSNLPYTHKIFCAGNHDWYFESNTTINPKFEEKGVTYLFDREVEIDGLRIYGSPWQPRFFDWAFNVDRGDAIAEKWKDIPKGLDVFLCHGPVHGILDYTPDNRSVGCEELYHKIMQVKPIIMSSGHLHCARGLKEFNDITFINASSVNEQYEYANKPIVLDYDEVSKKWDYISI